MTNNKPAATIKDGAIKATIWRNDSEKGAFYSVDLVRGYTTGEKTPDGKDVWKETTSLSGSELLKGANLLQSAYNIILNLKAQDAA